jgi:YidC/Oxa1 family membrane protein insertase
MADLWNLLIVQPIFNLLVLIYALIPGHNFGLAIIIFTVTVRLLMWPLVKKQLHQVKVMRQIQPELKKIKQASGGDKRKESLMMMELYKERGINPFGTIGVLLLQIPILIGLYIGLQKVLKDPGQLETFAYPFFQHLPWIEHIAHHLKEFDATLFGFIDLKRSALGPAGAYWPAMMIVIGSAVVQFFQSKQLSPNTKDSRSLRSILREAKDGKQADQSEVNAAVGRSTRFMLPALIFIFTVNIASALALYWLVSGVTALVQQHMALKEDTEEMKAGASAKTKGGKAVIEGEVVAQPTPAKAKQPKRKTSAKKRRKK